MIKMAIFDTNQGKECKPMTQYARKDYVSLYNTVGGIFKQKKADATFLRFYLYK